MATKRYTPLDDPPSASSDDDETEEEDQEFITQKPIHSSSSSEEEEEEVEEPEEEEEEDDDEDEENPQFKNPNSNPPQLSSEEESDSDSDSDSKIPMGIPKTKSLTVNSSSIFEFDSDVRSPTASDFAIKPSKKIDSFDVFDKTPTSKRRRLTGAEVNNHNSNNTKKKKKEVEVLNGEVDEEKKSVSKRVWTVEDELMLLQGFIDYQMKIGCSPLSDMDGFYQFTMSSLLGSATKSQLYEKVRRLKKKFRVNSEKVGGNGEEPVFVKPHERKLFELSNKIWGVAGCENVLGGGGGSRSKGKIRVAKVKPKVEVIEKEEEVEKVVKVEDFETLYPYWNAGLMSEVSTALKFPDGVVKLVKENLSLIGEAKAKELNEKWEAIFENEAVLRKRRIALLSKVGDAETA